MRSFSRTPFVDSHRFEQSPPWAPESRTTRVLLLGGVAVIGILVGLAVVRLPLTMVVGALSGCVAAGIVLRYPFVGLILYAAVFELRLGELYPALAPLRLERVVGGATLIAIFIEQYGRTRSLYFDRSLQSKLLLFFCASVLLSIPTAYWRMGALEGFSTMMKALAFYAMVLLLITTRKRLRWFLGIYGVLIAYNVGNALYHYFTGRYAYSMGIERAIGSTSANNQANFLGGTIASAFPLFFLMATWRPFRWWNFLSLLGSMILATTLVCTGSRGSMLGFIAGLVFLWSGSRRRLPLGVLGIICLVAAFVVIPDQYKERYSTLTSSHLDASSMGRVLAWKAGLRMFAEKPLFGVGVDNFLSVRWAQEGIWLEAHSLYITVLAELGLIGSIGFYGFVTETIRTNWRTRKCLHEHGQEWAFENRILWGLLAGFVALSVAGAFGMSPMLRTWYVFSATGLAISRLYLGSHPERMTSRQAGHGLESDRHREPEP